LVDDWALRRRLLRSRRSAGARSQPEGRAVSRRTVDEHLAEVLGVVRPLDELDLTLLDAHGCVLTEPVTAASPLPGFDAALVDGYAVRCADVAAASAEEPAVLPVVGDVGRASATPYTVQPGLALRISAGAPVPTGAEAIVPASWTDNGVAEVAIRRSRGPGAHVRRAGSEAAEGTVVVPAGTRLGAVQLGLLAALGRQRVRARPRPRAVMLSTGDELVDSGRPVGPGQLPDANSYLLAAAAREAGATSYRAGVVPDEPHRLLDALEDQLIRADVIVTTGGLGGAERMHEVLARFGSVALREVAIEPGGVHGFGVVGPDATPLFALPGDPVSAFVAFEVFVRPALRRMIGAEPVTRPALRATTLAGFDSPVGLRSYRRGRLSVRGGVYAVEPVAGLGISGLARANCLVVVEEAAENVPAGRTATAMVLDGQR
jgi:molybdopterin molybdotransferase